MMNPWDLQYALFLNISLIESYAIRVLTLLIMEIRETSDMISIGKVAMSVQNKSG